MDAWLFYDHHGRDPLAYRVLRLPPPVHVTRRWYYLIPAVGEPQKLVHRIEAGRLDTLPGARRAYSAWQELERELRAMLAGYSRIAMQYSPRNAIMYVSMVDAGTVELLRAWGMEIVSSADLISRFEAVLSPAQIASHYAAQRAIDAILPAGRHWLRAALDAGRPVTENTFQQWFIEALEREQLVYEHPPNVSVNGNSADSHYDPTPERALPIREGDFLLVDIWGRQRAPGSVFYDITWTGTVGRAPRERELEVFCAVRDARDAAIALVQGAFVEDRPIAGWEADAAARAVIAERGFAEQFTHRTGHNIASELHGAGAHLDNLETHDERLLLPHTCFSVEPGVYHPDGEDAFGVRSEVNMLTAPGSAVVTGRIQRELLRI